jgi:O-antigen ligase
MISLTTFRQCFTKFGLAHLGLVFIGLMWVLPFLYYRHANPLTTFYEEWGAAVLGLCAMPLLATQRYWQQPEIPRIVLLPIGLMLLVLVQFAFGKIDYFSQTLLITLYLLWAALLIMLGQRLREELGLPMLVTVLAAFLLLGAELSALVGVIQHFRWSSFLNRLILVNAAGTVFGNMGQPNHFADYISLGLISLGLLHTRWRLRAWKTALLAAPMLFVLVLSGSRSPVLYLLFMAGLAFLWQRRDKSNRPLLYYSLLLVLGFGLMHFVVQIPWLAGDHGSVTTLDRMIKATADFEGGGTSGGEAATAGGMTERSIRLHIWYEAWLIFTKFPLLGAGFGQFGWQHFLLGPSLHNTNITGLYNNAHNIVMQTAAEMGLAGLLILFGTLTLWIRQLRAAPHTAYHWWGGGVLAVLAIHSLLEYPLWYAYFLGVAALTLGVLDGTTYRLELRNVGRLSVASIWLLGVLSLWQVWQDYRYLEEVTSPQRAPAKVNDYFNELMAAHGQALLQPYVEVAMSSLMEGRENLAGMRELNESVMHFVPIRSVVYREVWMLALSGEQAAAQLQLERAIWAFPEGFPAALDRLRSFAQKDPAHFAALLEFAPKKYEEYQLAVHSK